MPKSRHDRRGHDQINEIVEKWIGQKGNSSFITLQAALDAEMDGQSADQNTIPGAIEDMAITIEQLRLWYEVYLAEIHGAGSL